MVNRAISDPNRLRPLMPIKVRELFLREDLPTCNPVSDQICSSEYLAGYFKGRKTEEGRARTYRVWYT